LALAQIDNTHLTGLTNGLEASTNGRANISGSIISGNASNGLLASTGTSIINAENNQITFNDLTGVNASISGASIRLTGNDISNNTTGISIAVGATVFSAGNNRVFFNGSSQAPNGAPPLTVQ
jgi:hypothetical protein